MTTQFTNIDRPTSPQATTCTFTKEVVEDTLPWDGDCETPEYVLGVFAKATFFVPIGWGSFRIVEMRSGGLWGVGVDSLSDPYLDDIYQDELAAFKEELLTMGKALALGDMW